MTSEVSLDAKYLEWLYRYVGVPGNRNPARSFRILADQLFTIEFEWSIPNDDNRIEDGRDLREEFLKQTGAERNRRWIERPCSFLEMLIALCLRAEFESNNDSYYWFWRIMENLGIAIYADELYDAEVQMIVDDVVRAVIDRQYRPDGVGGLFPLRHPDADQREVEIWYQMSAYLLENGYD